MEKNGKESWMGMVIKETPGFLFQMSKKGVKIVAKNPAPGLPKYGMVSHAWWEAASASADDVLDAAILTEVGMGTPVMKS